MSAFTVIAEAGVNHNGSLERALEMIDVAASAGADYVKFQTFRSASLVTKAAPKAAYQERAAGKSQLEMLQALELPAADHKKLMGRCAERGIGFLSTPFDFASLDLLAGKLGVARLKLGSGELTNAPFLLAASRTGKPIILSTGMGTLAEIETALGILAFGYVGEGAPSREAFRAAYDSADGQAVLRSRVVLLHCTSAYPAPDGDINLRAIETLRQTFGLPVGLSDHSQGLEIALAAPAAGAVMLEKHFTLDRALPGPDHAASLEPDELARLVAGLRRVTDALGDGVKAPRASEADAIAVGRKSLVAAQRIAKGAPFTADNLTVKRPGTGLAPIHLWDLIGRTASRSYQPDDLISEEL